MGIKVRRRRRSDAFGPEESDEKVAQWRAHRAEIERLKLEKMRGEMLDRATAMAMFAGWVRTFARGVMAVEGRMAHLLTDEQRRTLKEEHRLLLEALSRSGEKLKDKDTNG